MWRPAIFKKQRARGGRRERRAHKAILGDYILRDIVFISTSIERQSSLPCRIGICGGIGGGGGVKLLPGTGNRNEGSPVGGGGGGGGMLADNPGSKPAFCNEANREAASPGGANKLGRAEGSSAGGAGAGCGGGGGGGAGGGTTKG